MLFSQIAFTIQDEIDFYDLYYCIYVTLKENKLYSFGIYQITKDYRQKIDFDSEIGNPRVVFDMVEQFRHKPSKYFDNLNSWISRKDVRIEPDKCLEKKRSDNYNEFYTVEQIKLY